MCFICTLEFDTVIALLLVKCPYFRRPSPSPPPPSLSDPQYGHFISSRQSASHHHRSGRVHRVSSYATSPTAVLTPYLPTPEVVLHSSPYLLASSYRHDYFTLMTIINITFYKLIWENTFCAYFISLIEKIHFVHTLLHFWLLRCDVAIIHLYHLYLACGTKMLVLVFT